VVWKGKGLEVLFSNISHSGFPLLMSPKRYANASSP